MRNEAIKELRPAVAPIPQRAGIDGEVCDDAPGQQWPVGIGATADSKLPVCVWEGGGWGQGDDEQLIAGSTSSGWRFTIHRGCAARGYLNKRHLSLSPPPWIYGLMKLKNLCPGEFP